MPVYSMTGYASATADVAGDGAGKAGSIGIELRSVNSRFLDLALRLPDDWRDLEPMLREQLGAAFKRGKIELRLSASRDGSEGWPHPRPEQLARLARTQSLVLGWLPDARALSVNEALTWCRQGADGERAREAVAAAVRSGAAAAIEGLAQARAHEGARLAAVLGERSAQLRALAARAVPLVPEVVARQQQRFVERWNEALAAAGDSRIGADAQRERALAEAAAYALRIDVAEELSRLVVHLDEIDRLLHLGGELGKRLDFLIQELHREANTLGSKSQALELTAISVEMKVAIEQMREQVQNIE